MIALKHRNEHCCMLVILIVIGFAAYIAEQPTVENQEEINMKWYSWKATGTVTDLATDVYPNNNWPIFEIDNGRVFFVVFRGGNDGIYRADLADYTSWTKITALGTSSSKAIFHLMGAGGDAGRIYCWNGVAGNAIDPEIYYSDNNGTDWTATDESNLNDYEPFAFFEISGSFYVAAATAPNRRRIDIFKYNSSTDTYTSQANVITDTTASATLEVTKFGVTDGTDFYFIADYQDGVTYNGEARFWKYDDTGTPSITAVSDFQSLGTYVSTTVSGPPNIPPRVFATDDRTVFYAALTKVTGTNDIWLLQSINGGTSWAEVEKTNYQFLPDSYYLGNGVTDRRWSYITADNNFQVRYLDSNLAQFLKVDDLANVVDSTDLRNFGMSSTGVLFLQYQTGSDFYTRIYEYQDLSEKISRCFVDREATEKFAEARFESSPLDIGYFKNGSIIEFYTDTDVLAFRGRIVIPRNTNVRSDYWITAEGLDVELERKISKHETGNNSRVKMQNLIDTMKWLYRSSSIDNDLSISQNYDYNNEKKAAAFCNLVRELEEALFYREPDGKTHLHVKADAVSSGKTWSQATDRLILSRYNPQDNGITRSEVKGGYNTKGQVRPTPYIGDAAKEVTDGPVLIQRDDPNINNHTEANQLATKRYNIYGPEARIAVLIAQNFDYIQVGQTLTFSWDDGGTVITSGTFYFMKSYWDLKIDRNTLWLVDNIATEDEYRGIKVTRGEDIEINATYYDGTVTSSSDGTPLKQNPVGALKAGALVWLGHGGGTTEPTAAHFNSGGGGPVDLDGIVLVIDTWYDLDLSSILPKEARSALVKVDASDNLVGSYIRLRRNGQTGTQQTQEYYALITNRTDPRPLVVGIDDDQKLEILMNPLPAGWTTLELTILAYGL